LASIIKNLEGVNNIQKYCSNRQRGLFSDLIFSGKIMVINEGSRYKCKKSKVH